MKNTIIVILGLVALVAGYIAATSKLRLSLEGLEGKTANIAGFIKVADAMIACGVV